MESWSLPSEVEGYRLIAELACGGMATVYAARKVAAAGFERLVVIKRLHPHLTVDEQARALFSDEARHGAMLRHPNVVPVIDVIEAGEEILLVQPYVESVTLAQLLKSAARSGARLPPTIGLRIVCDVLSGLHEAHQARDLKGESLSLVHRDLSPQNVLVAVDGSSRLIDFGVSRAAGAVDPEGVALRGKFPYLSPEQVNGLQLDRRADLFAAGALLFEVLTGSRLFRGNDPSDTMMKVLAAEIPPPSSALDTLPAALDAPVLRALRRDRAERFQTAMEMMDALEAALPSATHREVSLRLGELCGEMLAERRELLEDSFALDVMDTGVDSGSFPGQPSAPFRPDDPVKPAAARRVVLGASLVLIAVALAAAVWFAGFQSGTDPVAAPPSVPAAPESARGVSSAGGPGSPPPPSAESAELSGKADLTSGASFGSDQQAAASVQETTAGPPGDPSPDRSVSSRRADRASRPIGVQSGKDARRRSKPALHDNPYAAE